MSVTYADFWLTNPAWPPFAPTSLAAAWDGTKITLDWDDMATATGYEIQRSVDVTSTNLAPGFDLWANNGTSTVTLDPAVSRSGDGPSSKAVTTGAASGAGFNAAVTFPADPGDTATMSAYVKGTAGVVIRPQARRNVTTTNAQGQPTVNGTDVTLTGGWDRVSVTDTLLSTENGFGLKVFTAAAVATTFWVDDYRLDMGSTAQPYQSPWWAYTSVASTFTDTSSNLPYNSTFAYRVRSTRADGPSEWSTLIYTKALSQPFAAFGIPL